MKLISYDIKMEAGRKEKSLIILLVYLITLIALFVKYKYYDLQYSIGDVFTNIFLNLLYASLIFEVSFRRLDHKNYEKMLLSLSTTRREIYFTSIFTFILKSFIILLFAIATSSVFNYLYMGHFELVNIGQLYEIIFPLVMVYIIFIIFRFILNFKVKTNNFTVFAAVALGFTLRVFYERLMRTYKYRNENLMFIDLFINHKFILVSFLIVVLIGYIRYKDRSIS